MKNLYFTIVLLSSFVLVNSQTTNISGIINSYAIVTGFSCQSVNVNSSSGFTPGDRVIIIQMKGAIIDTSNTTAFGTILGYNGAGNYEMATIQSISGNTINLMDSVLRTYDVNGAVQLIKVPVYGNVNVNGVLTCQAWNGSTGGVLAFEADTVVTLSADIDVSGKGFRGATLTNGSLVSCHGDTSNYFETSGSLSTAHKGEGIVNYNSLRADGKGSNGNGGGGGHDCNGGGAGGGNLGLGGHGGNSECNVSCPPYFNQNSGGEPGKKLNYSNFVNKIFLGGGGGAGHQNNNGGTPGTNGGGIVIIVTDSISGNGNFVRSDGLNNTLIANIDGQGGGGAGGTILFKANKYSQLKVSAQGGYGGVDNFTGTDCHGKGGGGGGGVLWTSAPIASGIVSFLSGGAPGVFTAPASYCYNGSNGATAGQNGQQMIDLVIPESTAPCITGIKNFQVKTELKIYPNPVTKSLTIMTPVSLVNQKYFVIDELGRIIITGKFINETNSFDVSALKPGIYFIRIGDLYPGILKFVKEN